MHQGIGPGEEEEYTDDYDSDDDYDDQDYEDEDLAEVSARGFGGVLHEESFIIGDMVVASFDYEAQDEDELTILVGDILKIVGTDDDDEGWYLAEIDGQQGFIPLNFVQKVQAEPASALGEAVLQADLLECERKQVQLTILSAQGLDARHEGCPYVKVDVVGQAGSSFRTDAVQAASSAWQHRSSLSLQPGASLRLSVYGEAPSQPDKFLGSAELLLLDLETPWQGELGLVDELGVMQGGLLSVALVPGLPIDEKCTPIAPGRLSRIDRLSMTPEEGRRTPGENPESNTHLSISPMPERAQTLSPSLAEIKRKARQVIEEATRDGRLEEALQQIPKSASSVQKEASMARASEVKRQAWAMLLQAAQDGNLQKALAQIPKKTCSMTRADDVKGQAWAVLSKAAQNGDLEKELAQQASIARAGDVKQQARAMLLQAAQDGNLQKALAQIPKKTCSESSLAMAEEAKGLARALLTKVFLATAESSQGAVVVPVPPAPDEEAAESFQVVFDELVPPIACSAQDEVARESSQHALAELALEEQPLEEQQDEVASESSQHALAELVLKEKPLEGQRDEVAGESSQQSLAELALEEQPLEGHLETFFALPRRPVGPPPAGRRLPPARKLFDLNAELHEDQRRLRSKHFNNLQQQRLRNLHAQAPAQGSEEASILSVSSELGPDWYQDRMLEHFQRRRHLRGPGAAAVFEPSQPDPHKVPRATSRPQKQHSPAVAPSPFQVKPPTKQRGNGMHSQARPQPPALKRAGVPTHLHSSKAPLMEDQPQDFPEFSEDVEMSGVAALYGVYTALVCNRKLEDQRQPFGQNSSGFNMDSIMSTDSKANLSRSEQQSSSWRPGMSTDAGASKKFSQTSPGLAAFVSQGNPWHWPRDGGVPPMDAAVVALLKGQPPPTKVTPEQTQAARQALRLPVVRKTQQIPKWPDPAAKSSPRKQAERPYWLRGPGKKMSPGPK